LEIANGAWKAWFGRIDATIGKNGSGYLVGDKLTIADIKAFSLWNRKFDSIPADYFEQFPHIVAHQKLVASDPKIAEYYAPKTPLTLKLTYFDVPGLAESVRLALHAGGIQFEDERLSNEQFAKDKAAGRFKNGQVPVLDVNGTQIAQSNAILIYAGKLARLYPWDPLAALKVEEALGNFDDIGAAWRPVYREQDPEKKAKLGLEIFNGAWKAWFGRIDATIGKNGSGYLVGDKLTIADLRAFILWSRLPSYDGILADYLEQFPHIVAHQKLVASDPKIAEYYASHKTLQEFYPKK